MMRPPPMSTRTDTLFPYTALCRFPAGDRRDLHLGQEVVREGVGAEAERDAGAHVAADMVEGDAAAPEHVRAMGDAGTGADQAAEIVGLRPVQPGGVVQEDAVADDRAVGQHPEVVVPLPRRHSLAAVILV